MAKVKTDPFVSSVNGSVGGYTFTQDADGNTIMRAKATNVANPQTIAQQNQRTPFGKMARIAAYTPLSISRGWRIKDGERKVLTARNRFISYNMLNNVQNGVIDYSSMKFGRGTLEGLQIDNLATAVTANSITVSGDVVDNSGGINQSADRSFIVSVNIDTGQTVFINLVHRGAGAINENKAGLTNESGKWLILSGTISIEEYDRHTANGAGTHEARFQMALTQWLATDLQSEITVLAVHDLA